MRLIKFLLLLAMFTPACSGDDCGTVIYTPITTPPPANAAAVEAASESFWASCPDGCTLESNGTCCWCPNKK
jgi:hypothetical protein